MEAVGAVVLGDAGLVNAAVLISETIAYVVHGQTVSHHRAGAKVQAAESVRRYLQAFKASVLGKERVDAVAAPALNDPVKYGNVCITADIDAIHRTGDAEQGKPHQIHRHIVRQDGDSVGAADAGERGRQVIRAGVGNVQWQGRNRRARLDLVERLHRRPRRAGRREVALGEGDGGVEVDERKQRQRNDNDISVFHIDPLTHDARIDSF